MWDMPLGIGWWWIFGGVWMLIFWGGLITLIVWGVTKLSRRNGSTAKHGPLDVAKERYAKGEISRDEYEQLRKDLS